MKSRKIIGLRDGPNKRNETYLIDGFGKVKRLDAVRLEKQGVLPNAMSIKIKEREYLKDRPDGSKKDNINKE